MEKINSCHNLKKKGNTKIDKLRIINIYETDYTLILKYCLHHKVTHHVDQHNLLGETQCGTIPMRTAETVALIDECVAVIIRISYITLAKVKNDAVAYFDYQVNSHAVISSKKCEVLDQACKLSWATRHQTNYYVKIVLCVSGTSYCSTPYYPLYGIEQGSGCAGTTWFFQTTSMMETIKTKCQGFDIKSPDSSQLWTQDIIGLVDYKWLFANDWKYNSEQIICENYLISGK